MPTDSGVFPVSHANTGKVVRNDLPSTFAFTCKSWTGHGVHIPSGTMLTDSCKKQVQVWFVYTALLLSLLASSKSYINQQHCNMQKQHTYCICFTNMVWNKRHRPLIYNTLYKYTPSEPSGWKLETGLSGIICQETINSIVETNELSKQVWHRVLVKFQSINRKQISQRNKQVAGGVGEIHRHSLDGRSCSQDSHHPNTAQKKVRRKEFLEGKTVLWHFVWIQKK